MSDILQNKITGTLTSEKNRRHIKMTAFDAGWASVEQSVRALALFKQSSVEQEGMAHVSLLLHVEDEVPEVDPCDFLPWVLPGGRRAQPSLAAPAQPRALQGNSTAQPQQPRHSSPSCCVLCSSSSGSAAASFSTRYMVGVFLLFFLFFWVSPS